MDSLIADLEKGAAEVILFPSFLLLSSSFSSFFPSLRDFRIDLGHQFFEGNWDCHGLFNLFILFSFSVFFLFFIP